MKSVRGGMTRAEELAMRETFKATMRRAADILDKITASDVLEAQADGLSAGMTLAQVAKIDRAMIGAAHLRTCAEMSLENDRKRDAVRGAVRGVDGFDNV